MTKTEDADIRELQIQMKAVTDDISEMKQDIKTILMNQDNAYNQLKEQKADKSELKTFKWVTVPLTILATTIITLLVQDYFNSRPTPAQPQSIEMTNER